MKRLKRTVVVIGCLILLQSISWGATYYLDVNSGNDNNSGTSALPWKTLSKAQKTVTGGDTIVLFSGFYGDYIERYIERTDWITYKAAGGHIPVLSRILVDNQGRTYDTYLIFDGLTIKADPSKRSAIEIRCSRYTQFLNLNIIGCGHHTTYGFYGWQQTSDFIIDGCTFSGGEKTGRFDGFNNAVYISGCTNVIIQNNEIRQFHHYGILLSCGNNIIRNNNIHMTGGDGIFFGGGDGLIIENNKIHDLYIYIPELKENPTETTWSEDGTTMYNPNANWGSEEEPFPWPSTIEIYVRSGNNVNIKDNNVRVKEVVSPAEIIFNKSIKANPNDPAPSNVDYFLRDQVHGDLIQAGAYGNTHNVTIRGNEFYDCYGQIWWLNPYNANNPDGIGGQNFIIENNLCWNHYDDGQDEQRGVVRVSYIEDLTFRNNTIIGVLRVSGSKNITFFNNIVSWVSIFKNSELIENDYNIFNRGGISDPYTVGPHTTFLYPGYSWDKWNDPKFISIFADYNNGDFRYASASSLGVGYADPNNSTDLDILGNKRDAQPDAGCYEYGAGKPEPPQPPEPPEPPQPPEPHADIPDITSLRVSNNIIKRSENTSATIQCNLKEAGDLSVKIYDAKGREIVTLCDEHKEAGIYTFNWSGKDDSDNKVGSGIYIVHMKAGKYTETKKIAVIK